MKYEVDDKADTLAKRYAMLEILLVYHMEIKVKKVFLSFQNKLQVG